MDGASRCSLAQRPAKEHSRKSRLGGWRGRISFSRLDQNNRTPQSIATVHEFVERKFLPEHVALLKKAGKVRYGKRHEKTGE
jgi:hypothetical protein